jgi:hypothetical protein
MYHIVHDFTHIVINIMLHSTYMRYCFYHSYVELGVSTQLLTIEK